MRTDMLTSFSTRSWTARAARALTGSRSHGSSSALGRTDQLSRSGTGSGAGTSGSWTYSLRSRGTRTSALFALALTGLLVGCGPSAAGWVRSGIEPSQLERDHQECEVQAEALTGPATPQYGLLGIYANRARARDLHAKCMRTRGYVRLD